MKNKSFFKQVVSIEPTTKNSDRIEFIKKLTNSKRVLHVGFADYPITNLENNLHIQLSTNCLRLDGIDTNLTDEIVDLLTVSNGQIYRDWTELEDNYDVIIVPEVIEHVDNVKDFLSILSKFSSQLIFTAPCAYYHADKSFRNYENMFVEMVHPDHNCWYTPYTLKNVVEKYTNKKVDSVHMLKGSVAVICN